MWKNILRFIDGHQYTSRLLAFCHNKSFGVSATEWVKKTMHSLHNIIADDLAHEWQGLKEI